MKHFSSDQPRRGFGHPTTLLLAALLLTAVPVAFAQTGSVGIGTTAPDVSAALDIVSSSKGALLPRVADATTIATPATGLLVFQTGGTPGFYYNAGTPAAPSWQQVATATGAAVTASNGLTKTGNNIALGGTLTGTTTIAQAGNNFSLTGGKVGIGTTTPIQKLEVDAGGIRASGAGAFTAVSATNQGAHLQWNRSSGEGETWLINHLGGGSGNAGIRFAGITTSTGTVPTEWARFLNNGNFGIGTTAPTQKLDVAGNVRIEGLTTAGLVQTDAAGNLTSATAASFDLTTASNGLTKVGSDFRLGGILTGATTIGLGTNSLSFTSTTGTVGIGATSAARLHVRGLGNAYPTATGATQSAGLISRFQTIDNAILDLGGNSVGGFWLQSTDLTNLGLNYPLTLNPNGGNVGIGTTSPGQKLDVTGNTNVTGNSYVGGKVGIGTTTPGHPLTVQATGVGTLLGLNTAAGADKYNWSLTSGGLNLSESNVAAGRLFVQDGGNVGIGTTSPAASALLDVASTTKGFLPPRLSQAQRDAIGGPAAGLTLYNTSTNKLNTWNGTSWDAGLSTTEQALQGGASAFAYTGAAQTYTVPVGVFSLNVDAAGAEGGVNGGNNRGGPGARAQATLAVTPGEVLTLYVGGAGSTAPTSQASMALGGAGYNGGGDGSYNSGNRSGGGGGASDVRRSGTVPSTSLADRLLVAAGGGGGGEFGGGGAGGATTGDPGGGGPQPAPGGGTYTNGIPGTGGTQSAGGTQSMGGSSDGALGTGGSDNNYRQGGGGGGGYYGGGAGYRAGGGGGSSWVSPASGSDVALTGAYQYGHGSITITPGPAYATPVLNGTNFTSVASANGLLARGADNISQQGAYLQWNRTGGEGETWLLNQQGGGGGNAGIRFGKASTTKVVTEWARFLNNGNFGIGTTNPGQALTVIGNICASGGVNCASDGRYKRNVAVLPNALASVLRLRGVTYYWKQAEFPAQRFPATRQLGFIAQEVEPLYPEMVSTDDDGYKSVDYARLTPVLVEAIKEQQAQIEVLKARAATAEAHAATAEAHAVTAEAHAVTAEAHAAQATATTEAFEARLRRLEAPGEGQARK